LLGLFHRIPAKDTDRQDGHVVLHDAVGCKGSGVLLDRGDRAGRTFRLGAAQAQLAFL
jgi:hypothetical protein